MAYASPSPNSSPSAVPPASTTPSPPLPLSPPLDSPPPSPSQPNARSPTTTPSTPSPLSQSLPSVNSSAPPLAPLLPPPPPLRSMTPTLPPTASPPLQSILPSPPPPSNVPPPSSNSPQPPSNTPHSSAPPPLLNPPQSLPPPPPPDPPSSSPPSPSELPKNSPPPPPPKRPETSPPPPSSKRRRESPPPPPLIPPEISPPPPESITLRSSPPPPSSTRSKNSTPPPVFTPSQQASPPSSDSPPKSLPSAPTVYLSPPPLVPSPSSPPPPSQVPIPTSSNPTTNSTSSNTLERSNSRDNGGIGTAVTVAIGLALGLILLSLLGTVVWCMRKRKKKVTELNDGYLLPTSLCSSPKSESALLKVQTSAPQIGSRSSSGFVYSPAEPGGLGNSRSWFTYEELVEATNGFSVQNLLGEGGFGCVYKGYLGDGREIAVKQLKVGGGQGEREFKAEVEIIGRIHHRHLVSLVGYCISDNRRLLVYEYVPNNTLYFHLHGKGRPVMDWATRIKVASGASRGIAYLHEDCHPRIIHRDIKSTNILLDNNFEARVSDFGLAKLAESLDANSHITTRVMGTFGYMAPEYASSGKLTEKSDVYSFGVVLLELITGRKPVDASQPLGDESLVEWARPLLSHALATEEFEGLVDPRLEKNYVDSEMFRMIEAAAACVRHSAAKRPRLGQVVRAFDGIATSDLTNGMRVGESEIFNSSQQSEEIRLFHRMAFGSQDSSSDFFSPSS